MNLNDNQSIAEASEILDTFDEEEIRSLVESQIFNEKVELIDGAIVDQFGPIYDKYKGLLEENENPDILLDSQERFLNICRIFLKVIERRYAVQVDDVWFDNNRNDVPSLTQALYAFFVIHHASNVEEALYNYIIGHIDELYTVFEDQKAKKDASTISNKKIFTADYAIILSNIYDVCSYVFDSCFKTYDDFFNCINPDDIYKCVLQDFFKKNILYGVSEEVDEIMHEVIFLDRLKEMMDDNVTYKGIICFKVAERIKRYAASLDKSMD